VAGVALDGEAEKGNNANTSAKTTERFIARLPVNPFIRNMN
jgi:hypothetical protein